ncbi:MAG: hypothetical protein JRH16_23055 [Deltaproteobacteria bacterium]|nr:hypothetical protein [Deltaproteobacteria bacterium]
MNHDVAADGSSARIARPAAIALSLIGALLLLAGTDAMADAEHPGEHRSGPTDSELGPAHSDHMPRHGGQFVHSDHMPRHGGQFVMSTDGYHHLEAALPRPDRFQVYLYDDHTRPIPATPFLPGARAWLHRPDAAGDELDDRVEIRLRAAPDGTRLEARIPAGASLPIEVGLELMLGPDRSEVVFDFNFLALSVAPIGETQASRKP